MAPLILVVLSLLSAAASAQAPKLGYVFPPAIEAGKATPVQLGGYDFTVDLEWFIHDDDRKPELRVKLKTLGPPGDYLLTPPPYWVGPRTMSTPLPIPREVPGQLETSKDTPAGLVRWQVANANGSSAAAMFYMSKGREIVESRSRDLPQRLPAIPVAVSGRLSRLTEVDRYEMVAEKDGLVSVELMARRLGTDFHGVLQVRDASGQLLADFADTQGHDGGVTFAARAGAVYAISLHDADFRGDRAYVYRLAVTPGPRVVCTLPAAGQRGTTREVEFIGLGVATGKPMLETVRQAVTFPADTAITGHTHTLATPFGSAEVTIPLSDLNETTRESATLKSDAPVAITAPLALTSALPDDVEHRYTWQAKKGEHWSLDLQSRAIGGSLDVALAILGPDGKQLAESDDLPGSSDAGLEFRAAADGMHTCIVRSVSSRLGAADEIYRLTVRQSAPDFSLAVPQQVNLALAGKAEVTVAATRLGGFDGEITVTVQGLPDGVTAPGPWVIAAGKKDVKITLQSAADAAVVARAIQFRGTAKLGDAVIARTATAPATGNLSPRTPDEQRIVNVLLAMTMPPPFEVLIIDRERQREVNRGKTYLADLDIARKEGFAGEVRIEMTAAQARYRAGMRGPIISIPAGQTRGAYPIFLPEWLPTDVTQRMNVQGVASVPDPKGNLRCVSKPADARITMIMEGALMKLSSPLTHASTRPGETFEVPVEIARSSKLSLPVAVEWIAPEEINALVRAEAITLAAGEHRGKLRITSVADARLRGTWQFTLKATALEDGKWPVVSQYDVPVDFDAPRQP